MQCGAWCYGVRCGIVWHSVMYYVVWCRVLFCSFVKLCRCVVVVCFGGNVLRWCAVVAFTLACYTLYHCWNVVPL